jgi:signal transduction histidine kinase
VRLGLLVAVAGAAALAGAAWLAYDFHAAWLTFVLLAPLGCATVLLCAAILRRRTGLRRQAVLIGAVAAAQLLATVLLFVELMFVSSHDAFFTVLATAYCAMLALWAGWVLSRRVLGDVRAVGASLAAVGEGRRDVHVDVDGADEVARLAGQVEAMVDRLARTEAARNDLVAAVSHDLRTPITSLRLLVEALDDDIVDEADRAAYLAKLRTHVRALGALIDDLFELSRLQAGELRWTMEQVRLADLVAETVEAMAHDGAARLVIDVPGDLAPARAAPEQIQRVLQSDPERDPPHAGGRQRDRPRGARGRRGRAGRGRRHRRGDLRRRPRPRVRRVLPGRRGRRPHERQRRARARDLARDRRGARWSDLGRAMRGGNHRAVHAAGCGLTV